MTELSPAAIALIKAEREFHDPHRLVPFRSVYCNVSERIEGTVRMEGRVCSHCGFRLSGAP